MAELTQERLKALVNYDEKTGTFTRRVTAGGQVTGTVAGKKDNLGYVVFSVDGKTYKAHRLAWLYVHGEWPKNAIDHIDGARSHNWMANLRPATMTQNKGNSRKYANNTSGLKGVRFYEPLGKWLARIGHRGRRIHLGYFDDKEIAHQAYTTAAKKLFGEFARAE